MDTTTPPPVTGQAPGKRIHDLTPPVQPGDRLLCTWSDQSWWTAGRLYQVTTAGRLYQVTPDLALRDDDGDLRPIASDTFRGAFAPRFERR